MVENILDLIGKTPILKLNNLFLKLEYFNPSGSIKDRMSLNMVEALEKKHDLKEGDYILETTSGNTGISLSMICAIKKYKLIILMYDDATIERRKIMSSYGTKVILVSRKINIEELGRIISKRLNIPFIDQHTNPNNYLGYEKMAQEIMNTLDSLDYLICGLGTGGTIYGLSRIIKNKYPNLKTIGVLPKDPNNCLIYGINSTINDLKFDTKCIDEIVYVSNEEALEKKDEYCKNGIFVGNSAGALLYVASLIDKDKKILVIIPDNNFKYLSNMIINKNWWKIEV